MIDNGLTVTAQDVAAWVGRPGDPQTLQQAAAVLPTVVEAIRGYTRGEGFESGVMKDFFSPDLAIVVKSVCARIMANPSGLRISDTTGPFSHDVAGWNGFTLMEQVALNRWRVRAA